MPREYPEAPIVGVGAIVLHRNQALLVRRANEPGRGLWSIPGGAVELGETLQEATLREVREECGLEVSIGDIVSVSNLIIPDSEGRIRYHYVLVDLLAYYQGGQPVPGSDSLEVAWVTEEELERYDMPDHLRQAVRRALQSVHTNSGLHQRLAMLG